MKKILILFLVLHSSIAQSQEESNSSFPVIYGDLILGGAGRIGGQGGFLVGVGLNYQNTAGLFSFRYLENPQLEVDEIFLGPWTPIPYLKQKNKHKETALLYGKRWIGRGSSWSVSGGVSLNTYVRILTDENNGKYKVKDNYIGFPIEVNIKWFKSRKSRFRIMGLFPVGKPTSFGQNIGLKLVGNLSRNSHLGLGIVFGFGKHKHY